jgi:hypothetical protein
MSSITITGTLQPDGVTLRLDGKVALPSGPVTVTIQQDQARLSREPVSCYATLAKGWPTGPKMPRENPMNPELRRRSEEVLSRLTQLRDSL